MEAHMGYAFVQDICGLVEVATKYSHMMSCNSSSSLPSLLTSPPLCAALTTFDISATTLSAFSSFKYMDVPFRTPCPRMRDSTVSFVA